LKLHVTGDFTSFNVAGDLKTLADSVSDAEVKKYFPVALNTGEAMYMRGLYSINKPKAEVDALMGKDILLEIANMKPESATIHVRPAIMHARACICYLAMRRSVNPLDPGARLGITKMIAVYGVGNLHQYAEFCTRPKTANDQYSKDKALDGAELLKHAPVSADCKAWLIIPWPMQNQP
jgi:hypothetical protein